jgi:hypothetical protein
MRASDENDHGGSVSHVSRQVSRISYVEDANRMAG